MIIQLCGLSGVGKTTLSLNVRNKLIEFGAEVEILDGDEYRKGLCKDLGFSQSDRVENIRRLGFVAGALSSHGIVSIICAINPYEETRNELKVTYPNVKTIYLECAVNTLIERDTKGLYKRAYLPEGNPEKVCNLTGISDRFDVPSNPDLYINTGLSDVEDCANKLFNFIISNMASHKKSSRLNRSTSAIATESLAPSGRTNYR